ncbi:MAG: hypothetical protein LBL18_02460 [Bacteroidales bacterium]|nr:hypothetical protein [Bacteroidales bacterium]
MKKRLSIIGFYGCLLLCSLFWGCNHPKDAVVAGVYDRKLYLSELQKVLPAGLTAADSTTFVQHYITHWIEDQLLLHEADKKLSMHEKNFDKELQKYHNQLLINAYCEKLSQDTAQMQIGKAELAAFMKNYNSGMEQREIVRLNYVKLPFSATKLATALRAILFDNSRRNMEKQRIEQLCGDSIEYFIDDLTWLYLDEVQNQLNIDELSNASPSSPYKQIETADGKWRYIVVLLDYRTHTGNLDETQTRAATEMLRQWKKSELIRSKINSLYEQASKQKKIAR